MTSNKKRRVYKKKRYTVPIIILVLLIAARIYLPYWLKDHVNRVLADIPGYYGQVEDIDISLYRGAYEIKGLYLNKVNANTQIPFLNFPSNDISIEWKSLLKGKIVSEVIMYKPEVIYVFEDQKKEIPEEEGGSADIDDWTKVLTDLIPIDINHFEAHNAKVAFVELQKEPNVDLYINNIELVADNLRNVIRANRTLPSSISATGVTIGQGSMKLEGNVNLVKEIPDMDLSLSIENGNVTALNNFTRPYAGIDFESGTFGLYSEVAIADGYMKGYIKPLLTNTKLIGKEDGFLGVLWEGFVGFFKFLLKNQSTDTLATRVPLEGDLNNVEAGVWPTVFNIFENAWIKAFTGEVDDDIEFKDAFDKELSKEEKKDLRKERREERRKAREGDNK